MRYVLTILAGTLLSLLVMEAAAIAQADYRPCAPTRRRTTTLRMPTRLQFGYTNQGEWLELDPASLLPVQSGIEFTYYLNGRRNEAFTTCSATGWHTSSRSIPISSKAALGLWSYVCRGR